MKKFKLALTILNIKLFSIDIETDVSKSNRIVAVFVFVLMLLGVGALYLPLLQELVR